MTLKDREDFTRFIAELEAEAQAEVGLGANATSTPGQQGGGGSRQAAHQILLKCLQMSPVSGSGAICSNQQDVFCKNDLRNTHALPSVNEPSRRKPSDYA